MAKEDGLDNLLSAVGLGRWQIPCIAMFCLVTWVVPVHMIGSTLLSAPVAFRCSYGNASTHDINSSHISYLSNATTMGDDLIYYDNKCLDSTTWKEGESRSVSPGGRATGLSSCPEVEYDPTTFSSTIITEWNLICEKEVLRPLFQMMFSIGGILGTLMSGPFSDSFGRKRSIQVASLVCVAATIGMYFMPWYVGLLVIRVIIGAACNCMVLPSYNLALESIPPQSRTWIGVLIGLAFSIGVLGFSGLGYFIRSWRTLMLVSSSALLVLVPMSFWIDESPRWLLQNGGEDKVAQMMTKAAKTNRGHFNDVITGAIERLREQSSDKKKWSKPNSSIRDYITSFAESTCVYFRSPPMRTIIIVTPLVWLLQFFLYLGIMLNANNFTSNNPFAYIAISGAMDGTAILLATPFTMKLGRRASLFTCFLLGGSLLMVDLAVPSDLRWISWVLVMTALLLSAAAVQINFLYASEMFPTSIRARGFGWAHFAGNIGFILAPLVTDLLSKLAWWSVSVTFGCAGLVASLLVPLLPETNNRPLPETILDVEERYLDNKLEKKRKISIKRKKEADEAAQRESVPLT